MKFKHLFFDLDNTILDFSHASHKAFADTLSDYGRSHESAYEIYNEGNRKVWSEFEKGQISAYVLRGKRFDIFLEKMGWSGDGLEWNQCYLEHVVKHTHFVDGANALLHKLRSDYELHIVTNGLREVQRPRLKKAEIYELFSSITVSDEIGHAKPQSQFFEIAMENAGLQDRGEVLMIGDSYHSDITGGHLYGLSTCWLNAHQKKVDSKIHDFEIHHINELEEVIS